MVGFGLGLVFMQVGGAAVRVQESERAVTLAVRREFGRTH